MARSFTISIVLETLRIFSMPGTSILVCTYTNNETLISIDQRELTPPPFTPHSANFWTSLVNTHIHYIHILMLVLYFLKDDHSNFQHKTTSMNFLRLFDTSNINKLTCLNRCFWDLTGTQCTQRLPNLFPVLVVALNLIVVFLNYVIINLCQSNYSSVQNNIDICDLYSLEKWGRGRFTSMLSQIYINMS